MTIVKVLSAVEPLLEALIVKLAVPKTVGVPEITPDVLTLNPVAPLDETRE
jgi:hypothetical protein